MADADEISKVVLSEDVYGCAKLSTRRLFPFDIRWRIRLCILALASSAVLAPATYTRRDLVYTVEGETATAGTLTPAFTTIALVGILITLFAGLFLIWVQSRSRRRPLSHTEAKRLLLLEDVGMVVAISPGISFILIGVCLSMLGLVAPELVLELYGRDVRIYASGSGIAATDTWYTSFAGFTVSGWLLTIWWASRSRMRS